MELQFDKYCKVGRSPRTVLPSPHPQTKVENRSRKEKVNSRNYDNGLLNLEKESFPNGKFRNYRSVSCKNLPSEEVELERNELLRRGSVYQSTRDRNIRRPEISHGRKKIEFSLGSETSFSFSLLDSICGSDEEAEAEADSPKKKASIKPSNLDMISSARPPRKPLSRDLKERQSCSEKYAERDSMEDKKLKCHQVSGPCNDANVLKERGISTLNKSLSAKLALPHSPTRSEGGSSKSSPKSRFSPITKMFDPLTKAKSQTNKDFRKSLLRDFSSVIPNVEPVSPPCSPAHLNGNLKMEQKHGVPYFEFSMPHCEDVFVAKTWKDEDTLSWLYTFHSIRGRKRSNKDAPMVGQMQVSCYLCSKPSCHGAYSESIVTEFVFYDIAHARKSVTAEEKAINCVERSVEGNVELDDLFGLSSPTNLLEHKRADVLSPYPWAPADLHPSHEMAAVVIQVPFEKRESLKYKRGDRIISQDHASLLDLCSVGEGQKGMNDEKRRVKVNVVTPMGNHYLPSSDDSRGPSPLIDRWRVGGGCDCGGWDMACPLTIFGNSGTQCKEEHSLLELDQPLKLYLQGSKENIPALIITVKEKGQYVVDFHAQLSALQAFSVCVSILHTTEASSSAEQEKNKQLLQCSSLKVLVEDEMKIFIEGFKEDERKNVTKMSKVNPSTFVLKPPVSPFSRV